jgi:segregation and condensation protein B
MELKSVIEALLFASPKALTADELRGLLKSTAAESEEEGPAAWRKVKREEVQSAVEALAEEVDGLGRAYRLVCVAGAWQFASRSEYGPWLRALLGIKARPPRLSQPALETLAIIAYRQPITRAEMEQIRGVSVDGVLQTLTDRGLVEVTGKAEVAGRPSIYATTSSFLDYFGLRDLEELPAADELRRLPVERPEGLLTADPGLATVPPEELAQPDPPAGEPGEAAEGMPSEPVPLTEHEPH